MCNPSHTAGGTHGVYSDGQRHPSQAQGAHPEEGSTMAIILIEEVLMGLDEVKASLEQAMTVLDVLVDDLSPALGEGLRTELEHTLRQPLRGRLEVLEHLQATVDALAA
jgi:hypothetical protein